MALAKCVECGREISDSVASCPHCGKKRPQKQISRGTAYSAIGGAVVFFIWLGVQSNSNDSKSQQQAAQPINLNDAAALDQRYGSDSVAKCESGVDDYLRTVSKYAFKWDDMGTFENKFDRHLKTTAKPGVLVGVTNKVSLQNGFGAYERVTVLCDYDTQAGRVLGYRIIER